MPAGRLRAPSESPASPPANDSAKAAPIVLPDSGLPRCSSRGARPPPRCRSESFARRGAEGSTQGGFSSCARPRIIAGADLRLDAADQVLSAPAGTRPRPPDLRFPPGTRTGRSHLCRASRRRPPAASPCRTRLVAISRSAASCSGVSISFYDGVEAAPAPPAASRTPSRGPARSFFRSKASRRPSFLTTM